MTERARPLLQLIATAAALTAAVADGATISVAVLDRRYVMVIESQQSSDDATARETITAAVKTMFPSGRIGA